MARVPQAKTKEQQPTEYMIYFIDQGQRHWWDTVFHTREGFRHCFMLAWDEWARRWLMIDARQRVTDVLICFDFEIENLLTGLAKSKLTVVRYYLSDEHDQKPPFFLSYCSNMIARVLGLKSSLILTPYQLYRKLIAAGGEITFDWRNTDEFIRPETNPTAESTRSATDPAQQGIACRPGSGSG